MLTTPGALAALRRLEPFAHPSGARVERERLIERATEALERLALPQRCPRR